MTLQDFLGRFETHKRSGGGYQVRCPAHEDNKASLNIKQGDKGILVKCHANCSTDRVLEVMGLTLRDLFDTPSDPQWRARPASQPARSQQSRSQPAAQPAARQQDRRDPVAVYKYRDEAGDLLFEVLRFEPKDFRQRRPDGRGGYIWKLDDTRRVLYRLPELLNSHPDSTVWIVEGEKDVDALRGLGFTATCSVGGAGKWRSDDYNQHLADRDVIVIPDNDQPGIDHAHAIELALLGVARSVRILTLPGLPPKGDVFDWLAIDGNDADRLVALADQLDEQPPVSAQVSPVAAVFEVSETGLTPDKWRRTHEGLALELLARANGDICYISDLTADLKADTFATWSGSRWFFRNPALAALTERQRLMTAEFRAWVQSFLDLVENDVESLSKFESAALRFSKEMESSAFKKAWREEIKAYGPIHAKIGDFDQDHYVLNCQNGTLDLRRGILRDFDRRDYLTRQLDFAFDPEASCPQWLRFLDTVFAGNRELIDYMQRAIGYTLTGDTSEQCLFLCHGPGANGKSVMLEVITALLGEFAQASPMTTFTAKPNDNGASNDLARMRGARLITASETNEGIRLNEALVKKITGQDTVTARFLYSEYFDFRPSFKLWIAMNHLPTIRGTDDGIWRRLRLIPFSVIIPEEQRDKHLTTKLKSELPGILAWALAGCLDWQRNGMRTPEAVNAATQGYRSEQDVLGAFIQERCIVGNAYDAPTNDLYRAYSEWAQQSGEYVISKNAFGRRMTDRGFKLEHARSGDRRIGVGLLADQSK
jgi:putative DNA primase/helicase